MGMEMEEFGRGARLHDIFLDRKHTPGMESENGFVRVNANIFNITKVTLLSNYVNVLLVFVPLGIVAGAAHWDPTVVFILNFFAIVPLAAVLSFATEEISVKLGQTMGGLLNATFGNAVELICKYYQNSVCEPTNTSPGQYRCFEKWRNPNCSVEYARKHFVEHSASARMLFCSRWHQQHQNRHCSRN